MSKTPRTVSQDAPFPAIGEIWQRAVYLGRSPTSSKHFVTVPFEGLGFVDMDIITARELVAVMNTAGDLGLDRWRIPTAAEAELLLKTFAAKATPLGNRVRVMLTNEQVPPYKHSTMVYSGMGSIKRDTLEQIRVDHRFSEVMPYFRPVCTIT